MHREDFEDDLIDLGTVSVETKGPTEGEDDSDFVGSLPNLGLSD